MLFNSIMNHQGFGFQPRTPINFAQIPGVTQMGPEAFMTPQEKYAAAQKNGGSFLGDRAGRGMGGRPGAPGTPAGGVPGAGGGGAPAPSAPTDLVSQYVGGTTAAGGSSKGFMDAIAKFLPMLMGG